LKRKSILYRGTLHVYGPGRHSPAKILLGRPDETISSHGMAHAMLRSFGRWAAANCAALPTANTGQYATWMCKPLLFWFPCKRRYINVPLTL